MALNINKSRLFKIAHAILRKAEATTISEALRLAWKAMRLQSSLIKGNVRFSFRKVSGEIRVAYGTLCGLDRICKPKTATSKPRRQPDDIICYYDIEKHAFRSFNAANLI